MYKDHFGLEQPPFRITPDTRLFYTGGRRGDVLEALVYAITSGEGIVKVVGEVGTGKTMLCRMLEERLPDNVQIAYLANPSLTPEDILHAVALELGLDLPPGASRLQVMHRLQEALLERHAANQRVVALVEEAQSMPVDTLEEIRLLSNLETKNEKLLQIVLFGQPELDANLALDAIRQLRERITHGFQLTPLGRDEIRDYVGFRLRASGYRGRDVFTDGAYRLMARSSEGLTRRVNVIADKAMLAAFAEGSHEVTARHIRVAVRDSEFDAGRRRARAARSRVALVAGGVALAVLAGAAGWYAGRSAPPPGIAVAEPGAGAATGPIGAARAAAPAAPAPVPVPESMPAARLATAQPAAGPSPADTGETAAAAAMAGEEGGRFPAGPAVDAAPGTAAADPAAGVAAVTSSARRSPDAAAPLRAEAAGALADRTPGTAAAGAPGTVVPAIPSAGLSPGAVAMRRAESAEVLADGRPETTAARSAPAAAAAITSAARLPEAAATRLAEVAEPLRDREGREPAARAMVSDAPAAVAPAPISTRGPQPSAPLAAAASPAADRTAGGGGAGPRETAASPAPAAVSVAAAAPPQPAPRAAAGADTAAVRSGDMLTRRLAVTRDWLHAVDQGHFSIQLLATDATQRGNLEHFLRARRRAGQIREVYVYETLIRGRPWYGVLYGEFASFSEAREALRALPEDLQRYRPFIRNISDIAFLG